MANQIIISSLAQNELAESFDWYEEQLAGLGKRFAEIIYNSINEISKDPEIYKKAKHISENLWSINILLLLSTNIMIKL